MSSAVRMVFKPNFLQAIVAKQFDNKSRFINATLVQDKEKINIPNTSTVTINAKRNDGAENSFVGEVNEASIGLLCRSHTSYAAASLEYGGYGQQYKFKPANSTSPMIYLDGHKKKFTTTL